MSHVPVPVFSVGNLSTGGTGKSPFVQMLARNILSLGKIPAIVSRGYGRESRGEVLVSDGETVFVDAKESGDELAMHAAALPIPIIANADRAAGAQAALDRYGVHAIILDDGFQHRQLYRDCNIVLVDRQTLEHPLLLPAGRLREPLSSLRRADVICTVGGVHIDDIPREYCLAHTLCMEAEVFPGTLYELGTGRAISLQTGDNVLAVAGIAKPERFVQTLCNLGYQVTANLFFADHIRYTYRHIHSILRYADERKIQTIITTEKDAVKLGKYRNIFSEHSVTIGVLPIEMRILYGEQDFYQTIHSLLFSGAL